MATACVVENRHIEAEMGTLCQRHPDAAHADNPQRLMVYIDTKPVRPDALRPLTALHPLGHFDHSTGGAEYQRHHRVGDRFGQYRRRVHQQYATGVERLDVKIIVAHGDGGRRAKLRHLLQQGGIDGFA